MGHSIKASTREASTSSERENELTGSEWDAEALERIDDRDAENIDLDIECINEALERKHGTRSA
jgi:hypothetical protein